MAFEQWEQLRAQVRLSRMLSMGFALSWTGLSGIGPALSVLLGIIGLLRSKRSTEQLAGHWMAWWCIVVGGLNSITSLTELASTLAPWIK